MPADSTPRIFEAFSVTHLARVAVAQDGALGRKRDSQADRDVGRATDHRGPHVRAGIDRDEAQAVRVRVRVHLQHLGDARCPPSRRRGR